MKMILQNVINPEPENLDKSGIPLILSRIKAGFPSPADDYAESRLDFNEYLIKHPAATFCLRVSGDSMIDAGISPNDLLIVDRSLTPKNNSIVVAVLNGELTLKMLHKEDNNIFLVAANRNFDVIRITGEIQFEVWGVVTHVIKDVS